MDRLKCILKLLLQKLFSNFYYKNNSFKGILTKNIEKLRFILTYLSTYLPIYLPTYLPIYLPTYLPTYLNTYLPTYLSIYLRTYLPTYLPTYIHIYNLWIDFKEKIFCQLIRMPRGSDPAFFMTHLILYCFEIGFVKQKIGPTKG